MRSCCKKQNVWGTKQLVPKPVQLLKRLGLCITCDVCCKWPECMSKQCQVCGVLHNNWFPSQCSYWKDLVFVLLVMCAASGRSACQSSVKCVGYFITIGSQASAAAAKISFVDLAHFTIQTGFVGCKIWLAFKHFSSSVPLAEVEKKELPFGAFLSVEHLLYLLSSPHVEPEVRES